MKNEYVNQVQQLGNLWWEMVEQQATRAAAQTQVAIAESARMAKESIAYQQKLAAEVRKIFLANVATATTAATTGTTAS
jgi:hypothetical protein